MCLFEDVNVIGYFLLCLAFNMGGINWVQWINTVHICHTWYMNTSTYNCKKFRRNVYLVFRAAFSWWSCFLILLYCSAGCHFIPFHQGSQVQLLKENTCTIHENLIDLFDLSFQYIILLNCIYMYKERCTCDGLHTWKPTVKPQCAAPTSCKWLTPISDHQSKTKKIPNQIYSLQLGPLINKHLRWATVATLLDDNFGVFHCFYPPVSNHFVFIPTFTVCTTLLKICEELVLPTTWTLLITKIAFFKGFSFTMKGANHFTSGGSGGWGGGGGGGGDFIKKKFWKLFILVRKKILHKSTVQTNNHAHTGVQWPG